MSPHFSLDLLDFQSPHFLSSQIDMKSSVMYTRVIRIRGALINVNELIIEVLAHCLFLTRTLGVIGADKYWCLINVTDMWNWCSVRVLIVEWTARRYVCLVLGMMLIEVCVRWASVYFDYGYYIDIEATVRN